MGGGQNRMMMTGIKHFVHFQHCSLVCAVGHPELLRGMYQRDLS